MAFTEFSEQLADWRLQESSRRFEGGEGLAQSRVLRGAIPDLLKEASRLAM